MSDSDSDTSSPAAPYKGYQIITWGWVYFAFTTPFVFIRLYVQLRFRYRPWREIFLIIAWLSYLGYEITNSLFNDYDWWNWQVPGDEDVYAKLNYAFWWSYPTIPNACKAALICFYFDLTPRYIFPKTWWAIAASAGFVAAAQGLQYGILLFGCWPFYLNWTAGAACGGGFAFMTLPFILNVWTDVLVYLIPFVILRNLTNLTSREKLGSYVMFAFGFFNITSAILICLYYIVWETDLAFGNFAIILDDMEIFLMGFQAGSAIQIICLPYCRRFFLGMTVEAMKRKGSADGLAGLVQGLPEVKSTAGNAHHRQISCDIETQTPAQLSVAVGSPKEDV